jgi:hypothetical protein
MQLLADHTTDPPTPTPTRQQSTHGQETGDGRRETGDGTGRNGGGTGAGREERGTRDERGGSTEIAQKCESGLAHVSVCSHMRSEGVGCEADGSAEHGLCHTLITCAVQEKWQNVGGSDQRLNA